MSDEEPKEQPINKEALSEAITLLGKCYQSPSSGHIEHAINLLRLSTKPKKEAKAIRADQIPNEEQIFYPTGVEWIDSWLRGGLRPQELVLIGATPHAGKTHTLAWFGIQYLLEGYTVLTFIGEDILADIRDCYASGVVSKEALSNLWIVDSQDVKFGTLTIEHVYEQMVKDGIKPDIIIIDHVDLMKGIASKADWEVVSEVMVELKMLAKRLNCIVITASQANYSKELKGNERFYRAKVGKAANADVILMIDDVMDDEYTVSLTKARGRKKLKAEERTKILRVDWDTMQIEDIT